MSAFLDQAERTVEELLSEARKRFVGSRVRLNRGKYATHLAEITGVLLSSRLHGYEIMFWLRIFDKREQRALSSDHRDVRRCYSRKELVFVTDLENS